VSKLTNGVKGACQEGFYSVEEAEAAFSRAVTNKETRLVDKDGVCLKEV
jgi:hypothetical protein